MDQENDMVHQQQKVNKVLIVMILVALLSVVMIFIKPHAVWLILLIISGFYGLYESKVKKQEDDEF